MLGRKKGEIRLVEPEIETEIIRTMSFLGATMIKKKKKREEKKTSEPESVRRGNNEKINVVFRGGVKNG